MICNYCNLNVPIVVQGLADVPNAKQAGEHQHVNVCAGCLIAITNKFMQQKQRR